MNTTLYAEYWRAIDEQDVDLVNASTEQILSELDANLWSMASKAARQLRSPLAETEDLVSVMHITVLKALRQMPRTVDNPAGYLVKAARYGLMSEMRRVFPDIHTLSLEQPRSICDGDVCTLLDFLPTADVLTEQDATLSQSLADVLACLRPSSQLALFDHYQFSNWTPRRGPRAVANKHRYLYHAHSELRQLLSNK